MKILKRDPWFFDKTLSSWSDFSNKWINRYKYTWGWRSLFWAVPMMVFACIALIVMLVLLICAVIESNYNDKRGIE